MSQRTLWEEGHETGRQVAVLGVAVTLTVATFDLLVFGDLGVLFDLCFVLLCVALALLVQPRDFFTVGVLPPLLMVGAFTLLGGLRPDAVADPGDGLVQSVVSGLGHHASALIVGYGLCLGVLALRHRVLQRRSARLGPQAANRSGSPAPTRTTSG